MKKLLLPLLAKTVTSKRKALKMAQAQLAEKAGMNRSMLSRLESKAHILSIGQQEALAEALDFDPAELFTEPANQSAAPVLEHSYKIAVAGTGYVGLSLAVLLAQHNEVTAATNLPSSLNPPFP